jgi:uncharacterized protein YndB with AHSA1/START domain
MPVKKDASGRRSVQAEVEVPGTPEQVWQAIATGAGITSWFVPSEVEEREGGRVVFHLGPGMDSTGRVTTWQPPQRIAYEEAGWSEGAPPLATEFVIEALSGTTCRVRLVHSLFTSDDDWDDQLGSMETGWPPFFGVLRLYLRHFAGQRSAVVQATGQYPGPEVEAWQVLTQALGLVGVQPGERRKALAGAPPLAGTVQSFTQDAIHRELMLRLEQPAPGAALIGTYTWEGRVRATLGLYLYGDGAAGVAAEQEPRWAAWMARHFPAAEPAAGGGGAAG